MAQGEKLLRITQVRSVISRNQKQRQTLKALGIRRMHHTGEHRDPPQSGGMLKKAPRLVGGEAVEA